MTTIYLSSTYEDLKEHRHIVFDTLRRAGYAVIAMEHYVATDERPVEKCLADEARSDIYVGIFAFRYGYIPPPEHNNSDGLSITELELIHADKEASIPCLTFLVDEKTPWPNKFNDAWTIADHIRKVEEKLTKTIGHQALNQLAKIFRSLIQVDAEGLPIRCRALLSSFSDQLRPIVDLLIKERLFSIEGEGRTSTVSITHEKLFDAWPKLALWIFENRDDMRVVLQAKLEAHEWQKHEYDKAYLWHVERLKRLQGIIQRGDDGDIDTLVKQYAWPHDALIKRLGNDSHLIA